jgi:hypothetical protein
VADTGAQILESLRSLGVTVEAIGPDRLRLQPASKIPAELVPRIREAKPAILEVLRSRLVEVGSGDAACGSPHCAGCYEVESGARIHPPKCGESHRKWLERWQPKGRPQ